MASLVRFLSALSLFASLLSGVEAASRATLIDNGYEGVVVGLSPDIPEAEGVALIPAIKDLIKEASDVLFTATRRRAFFRDVRIVVPISWRNISIDEVAVEEKYYESDIRVDRQHPNYVHQPYTSQPGDCGDPGDFIHLTPEYLTDDLYVDYYGQRSKTLVELWAKHRWGVFDEIGYPYDKKYPLFFTESVGHHSHRIDVKNALQYRPNICSNEPVDGIEGDARDSTISCSFTQEGLPDEMCEFYAFSEQMSNSSLMSYSKIRSESIVEFCDHDNHIPIAPNKQNDKCDGQSIWEVMLQHEDFKNNANSETYSAREPSIKVVQEAEANYVLVLDYSGSMTSHDRIEKLQKAAQQFLLYEVALHSSVAIVRFDSGAQLLADLKKISSDADRADLAKKIHTSNDGGTSIGSGLRMAVDLLKGKNNKNILVITDGEENENPKITDVIDEVVNNKICVITVAFGSNADQGLEELAHRTKCASYTVNDNDVTNAMNNAFESSITRQPVQSQNETSVKLYETNKIYTDKATYSENFYVDSTIGKNLTFRLKTDEPSHVTGGPVLIRPDGTRISNAHFDATGFVWTIEVPLAEEGTWAWEVNLSRDSYKYIQATITSLQRDPNDPPITTTVRFRAPPTGVSPKKVPIKIVATVMKGNSPVVGANVTAVVTPPNNSAPKSYKLRDNGLGADSMKNDGIYSCYMTEFSGEGRYGVKATVTGGVGTLVNNGRSPSSNTVVGRRRRSAVPAQRAPPRCCGSLMPIDNNTATSTGSFLRVASGGSLKIFDPPTPGVDIIPPAKVTDLKVTTVARRDTGGYNVGLTWSAPGDDLDTGTASKYVFRLSSNRADLTKAGFQSAPMTTLLDFDDQALRDEALLPFGTPVSFSVKYNGVLEYGKEYFVGLVAIDEAGNESAVSSVDRIFLDRKLKLPEWAMELIQELKKSNAEFFRQREQE